MPVAGQGLDMKQLSSCLRIILLAFRETEANTVVGYPWQSSQKPLTFSQSVL